MYLYIHRSWVLVRVDVCDFAEKGECVCECASSVCLCHFVQPCSCVSRVDVLKWGHFLSVWCLRNNPTAQKLLQPSASTYLSLYLYCSGYAFLFDYCHFMLFGYLHAITRSQKVFDACLVAHNMRFWCFLSFNSPVWPATAEKSLG